jgi:hypothetical protein
MDKLSTYESFFSKWFKKKKTPFVPDEESNVIGAKKPEDSLQQEIDDILIDLTDDGFNWRVDTGLHYLDKDGKSTNYKNHHKRISTLRILIIKLVGENRNKVDFSSNLLTEMFYHLESYLKKEWNMEIYEIMVIYPYREGKPYDTFKSLEEFDKLDNDLQEIAIDFKIN